MAPHPKKGLRLKKLLVFFDEAGVSDRPTVRRTWAPKGKTPVISGAGGWKTRSVMSGIACEATGKNPRLLFMIRPKAVRSPDIIQYLKRLKRHLKGRKTVILMDGLRAHWSRQVMTFLKEERHWLEAERFPSYAPELNPQEYGWSAFRGKDAANIAPGTTAELDRMIRQGLRRIGRNESLLKGCLKASGLFKDI
jgi:transposase